MTSFKELASPKDAIRLTKDYGAKLVDLKFTVTAPTEVARQALRSMELLF